MEIKMGKFIFIFFLMPFFVNAQSLKCKLLKESVSYKDSIRIELENNFDKDICATISMEKKIGDSWMKYSRNVLNEPNSKFSTQILIKASGSQVISFLIQEPEILDPKTDLPVKGITFKTGLFRLKIDYGFTEKELDQSIISSEFRITKS